MNRRILFCFIKDYIIDSIAYFTACFLIGIFYYIDTGKEIEILYPLSLVLFVYCLWMLLRFPGYYKLYKELDNMACYQEYPVNISSAMNRKISDTLRKLHGEYLDRLSASEDIRKKDRRFLSSWIHSMKTPITVADLLLQRMERSEISTETGIKELKAENSKLLTSLNHVLNMIRLEEFARDYVPEAFDLGKELKSIINKNKSLFIYNRVFPKIITDLEKTVILSDRKWNELMINQIISNGVKYSREEEGTSKYIFFYIEKGADRITLTIQDEGIGIPEHDLGKVCDPFFTGDNGRRGYASSGIGLYFCSEVCKRLGHSLEITSKTGAGTAVKITYLSKV